MTDKCPACGQSVRVWGDGPGEFHVRSLRFDGPDGVSLYGLGKSMGGEIVEWAPVSVLRTRFTDEPRERFHHADMVRKVPPE